MRTRRTYKNRVVYLGLILGVIVGLIGAEIADRFLSLRNGQRHLDGYAQQLLQTTAQIDEEGEHAINTVLKDNLAFCSPAELSLMRGIVYNSQKIKDIGRVRNSTFFCSSEVGSVTPFPMPRPEETFHDIVFYGWTPVMFGTRGFVVQVQDVDIVLNSAAFETDKARSIWAYFYDNQTRTLIHEYGVGMPLTKDEIIAGAVIKRNGVYYRPLCSAQSRACVIAADTEDAMLAANKPFGQVLLTAGASIGDSIVLAFLLLYRRHRAQAQQLRRAIRRRELGVVYQPIVELASRSVVGLEVLARWTNEDGEIVPPDVFIAIAEERSFVCEITRLVVDTCLQELGDELRAKTLKLTVNITDQDLRDPTFLPYLQDSLRAARVEACQLGLELTERSAANHADTIATIAQLRREGHVVYIDDFGTGYSSLAYLADLNVDAIKIDRAFTASIGTQSITEMILPQVIQIAQQLRLFVVVEGIETLEQAKYFEEGPAGTLGQGWLFGRPMPASEFLDRVKPLTKHTSGDTHESRVQ